MKNGYGVYTWSEGTRWEGEWVCAPPPNLLHLICAFCVRVRVR
jgi:hypothetical protein